MNRESVEVVEEDKNLKQKISDRHTSKSLCYAVTNFDEPSGLKQHNFMLQCLRSEI